ncbi:MAG: NUDIX domain-containing protein [Candidatus Aminicenantes bacterium]|nr:NUDIX domain-containing protein [Candidatus Aminicenantes bacterium]
MNRLQLLKTLAPGFLPLVIFIAADALWGTKVGLAVAVVSGFIELAVSYARERTWDRFILVDTLLIILLGGISLLLNNDIFFKLKPALVELVFCLLLGISIYSPLNIVLAMSRRYLKGMEMGGEQVRAMARGMKALLVIMLGHTILIVYAAFALPLRVWGFISGGLFYILFGVYFLAEWGRGRRRSFQQQKIFANEECFDLVDNEGKVIGKAPRSVCHSRPGFLHPVVHLHVVNARDQIFLQKRSLHKQIQPGKWDTAVGGHVTSGEGIEAALRREAEEELGLTEFKALPVARYLWESAVESELVYMFVARSEQPGRLNAEEIDEGKFWSIKAIKVALGKGTLTPNCEFEFPILLEHFFGGAKKKGGK